MKFVTDGPTDQPTAPRASVRRVRSLSTRARLSSRIESSRRTSVTSVTEIVEIEPGGRNGFNRAITSGRATPNPTRRPARA